MCAGDQDVQATEVGAGRGGEAAGAHAEQLRGESAEGDEGAAGELLPLRSHHGRRPLRGNTPRRRLAVLRQGTCMLVLVLNGC